MESNAPADVPSQQFEAGNVPSIDPLSSWKEQRHAFPKLQSPQAEALNGHDVKSTVMSISVSPVDVCPSSSSQTANIPGSSRVATLPTSPSISVSPTGELPTPASAPEIRSEKQNVTNQSDDVLDHILPVAEPEEETATPGVAEPTLTTAHIEQTPSGQDDDVQFILSITRKRKKRFRGNLHPGHSSQDASTDVNKHVFLNINNYTHKDASLGPNTARLEIAAPKSLHDIYTGMYNAQDPKSFHSKTPDSLLATDPSSALLIPNIQKTITKKCKSTQNNNSTATLQTIGITASGNDCTPVQIPKSNQHLQHYQSFLPFGAISNVQNLRGSHLANESPAVSGLRAYYPPRSPGPPCQHTHPNTVQNHIPFLAGSVENATQVSLPSASMSEGLRRRPSLYAVPQWQTPPPKSGIAMQAMSAIESGSICPKGYVSKDTIVPGFSSTAPQLATTGKLHPMGIIPPGHLAHSVPSQARDPQQSTGRPVQGVAFETSLSKRSHPPNMLVDIAQTCQESFPFALVAKRHNQPIHKVFDTFSAIIQLPLLKSAVDARRPGKLGSLRMKEFRAMKKGAKEATKGEEAKRKTKRRKIEGSEIGNV